MKSLEDLARDLGRWSTTPEKTHKFYIDYEGNEAFLCDKANDALYITCNRNGDYEFSSKISELPTIYLKDIVNYLSESDRFDWFSGKRYNIIIANCTDGAKTYWEKDRDDFITFTTHDDKTKSIDFRFTESEIEELKSTLPENMAKIVDLGKVEVDG